MTTLADSGLAESESVVVGVSATRERDLRAPFTESIDCKNHGTVAEDVFPGVI